jgi:hypothetical protein
VRIVTIVANSGSRFCCENCSSDGGVAAGPRSRGHEAGGGSASPLCYGAVDLFLPVSGSYARYRGDRLAVPADRMRVVPVGVESGELAPAPWAGPAARS